MRYVYEREECRVEVKGGMEERVVMERVLVEVAERGKEERENGIGRE